MEASFSWQICFKKQSCLLFVAGLIPFPHCCWRSCRYSNSLHDFSVIITICCDDFYVNSFFLAQLDSGILCLQNAFPFPMINMALSLEVIDTFYLWVLSDSFSICFSSFFLLCKSLSCSGFSALHGVNPN